MNLTCLRQFAGFATISIREYERVVKNKIEIAELIDRLRRAGQRDEARWFGSIGVKNVDAKHSGAVKKTSLLPLEGVFWSAIVPNHGRTLAAQNKNDFLIEMPLRL